MTAIDPQKLRDVAGAFATGITVVCSKNEKGEITGMTANSFLSVSLDPPLVLFSIQNEGNFLSQCKNGKELGISILSSQQKEISQQFAGLNSSDFEVEFFDIDGCPIIKGAMAWYRLKIREVRPVGDHHLITCLVLDLDRSDGSPLIFYSGYRIIGRPI